MNETTARLMSCATAGMDYVHITMIEGIPAKVDFCGDVIQVMDKLKELKR